MSSILNSPTTATSGSGSSNITHRNNINSVDNSNNTTATPPSTRTNSNNNNNNQGTTNSRNNNPNNSNSIVLFLEYFINTHIQMFQTLKNSINSNYNLFIVVSAISFIVFLIVNLTPAFLLWALALIAITGTLIQIWYGLRYNSRIIEINGGYFYNNPFVNTNNTNNNNNNNNSTNNNHNHGSGGIQARLFFPNSQFSRLSHLINPPLNLQLTLIDRDFNSNDYDMLLQLDNDIQPHGGAKKEQIDLLPIHHIETQQDLDTFLNSGGSKDLQQKVCSICLDDFVVNDTIRTLPCIHSYHSDCIEKWLKIKSTCPVCKYELQFV